MLFSGAFLSAFLFSSSYSVCIVLLLFFFFNDTATTEIYTLSLHDALPISARSGCPDSRSAPRLAGRTRTSPRSEEHTSELQSRVDLVCRLLLEKKKKQRKLSCTT